VRIVLTVARRLGVAGDLCDLAGRYVSDPQAAVGRDAVGLVGDPGLLAGEGLRRLARPGAPKDRYAVAA
jgi:hypothetical protein